MSSPSPPCIPARVSSAAAPHQAQQQTHAIIIQKKRMSEPNIINASPPTSTRIVVLQPKRPSVPSSADTDTSPVLNSSPVANHDETKNNHTQHSSQFNNAIHNTKNSMSTTFDSHDHKELSVTTTTIGDCDDRIELVALESLPVRHTQTDEKATASATHTLVGANNLASSFSHQATIHNSSISLQSSHPSTSAPDLPPFQIAISPLSGLPSPRALPPLEHRPQPAPPPPSSSSSSSSSSPPLSSPSSTMAGFLSPKSSSAMFVPFRARPIQPSTNKNQHTQFLPVFNANGDQDPKVVNQQHNLRRKLINNVLIAYILVYLLFEIPYLIYPHYTIVTSNYLPFIFRFINAFIIIIFILCSSKSLYLIRNVLNTTLRLDFFIFLLTTISGITLILTETQRDRQGIPSIYSQEVHRDGLLLNLTFLYIFSFLLCRMHIIYSFFQACILFGFYTGSDLISGFTSTRYVLLSDAYHLFLLLLLLAISYRFKWFQSLSTERQRSLHLERKKAEKLLRSMLPTRILSDYLDGSIGQINSYATIGYCQIDMDGMRIKQAQSQVPALHHQLSVSPNMNYAPSSPLTPNTPAPELASPAELMQRLHDTFKRIDSIVSVYDKRGVTKIETVSKTYLLCSGLLEEIDDHAAAMIDVSLEILNMITQRSTSSQRVSLHLRVGISSGQVVGGIIGAQRRYFRVFGDTVNVAARMCTTAQFGQIQISQRAFDAMTEIQKKSYIIPPPVERDIKGKGKMLCYTVDQRADWVPKFTKTTMSRGRELEKDGDHQLMNKSFVYHRLMDRTNLSPFTLRYTPAVPSAPSSSIQSAPVNYHSNQFQRQLSMNMSLVPHSPTSFPVVRKDAANTRKESQLLPPARTASVADLFHMSDGSAAQKSHAEPIYKPLAPSSPFSSVSIESAFQLQNDMVFAKWLIFFNIFFILFLVGTLIYLVDNESVKTSYSHSPAIMCGVLLFCFTLHTVFLFYATCSPTPVRIKYESLTLLVAISIWCLIATGLWGLQGDISPIFIMFLYMCYAFFCIRALFHLVVPAVFATCIGFVIILIVQMNSYYDILMMCTPLFCVFACSTHIMFIFECRFRLCFLLSYALEREQEQMDKFLSNLLPNFVVQVLKQKDNNVANASSMRLVSPKPLCPLPRQSIGGGENLSSRFAKKFPEMTVFESDIVGYTKLVSNLTPLETLNLLNIIFSKFDQVAADNRVEKIETIGDAFMCVVFEGQPDPVLDFSLALVNCLHGINEQSGHAIQIRMGICTGPSFGGIVGTEVPRFTLFGFSHDAAIHIEQYGRPDEIIVSQKTYDLAASRYEFELIPDMIVDDFKCYTLRSKKSGSQTHSIMLPHRQVSITTSTDSTPPSLPTVAQVSSVPPSPAPNAVNQNAHTGLVIHNSQFVELHDA